MFTFREISILDKKFYPTLLNYYCMLLLAIVIILGSVLDPHFMVLWLYDIALSNSGSTATAASIMLMCNAVKLVILFLLGAYSHHLYRYIKVRIYKKR